MSKLTLRDYQSKHISDLFLALIVTQVSEEDTKEYLESLTPEDKDYQKVKAIKDWMNSNFAEGTQEAEFVKLIKDSFSFSSERTAATILVKDGDSYINVTDNSNLDMETNELIILEPFSDYYSENEYRFIENEGKIILDVDSIEPFEIFSKKIENHL
ncbi:MAG: hypothetical protein GX682_00550 [Clostridiaceae bacterium]|nr:hypothetical protein [Clostridiaceae bacterium]